MAKYSDKDLFCQKCQRVLRCRFRPSFEAGPYWRCSECGEIVECAGDIAIFDAMLSDATSLWYREYNSISHDHCPHGHPGMEGCPGGDLQTPCDPEDQRYIRSIIVTLEEVMKMKQKHFCPCFAREATK